MHYASTVCSAQRLMHCKALKAQLRKLTRVQICKSYAKLRHVAELSWTCKFFGHVLHFPSCVPSPFTIHSAYNSLFTLPTWANHKTVLSAIVFTLPMRTTQDSFVLSVVVFTPPMRTRQDSFVLSPIVFRLPMWTRQFCLVCSCVHTADTNKTRQDRFVLSAIVFTPPTQTRQDETDLSCL